MMPFSAETLVPKGPRNLGQSLPWARTIAGERKKRNNVMRRCIIRVLQTKSPGIAALILGPEGGCELLAALLGFDLGDLLDAAGVAAAFEGRLKPDADHL